MISIATYNIWFDHRFREIRTKALVELLSDISPTFICLQEVIVETAKIIIPHFQAMGYKCCHKNVGEFSDQLLSQGTGYGVLIFSKVDMTDIKFIPFSMSRMGRYFINAKIPFLKCRIVSTHLESLQPHARIRQLQIQQVLQEVGFMPFIWGMDSNLLPDENEEMIDKYDSFILAGCPSKHKITFDGHNNSNVFNPRYSSRLDRVLINRMPFDLKVKDFSLIGTTQIKSIRAQPSDHFGVLVILSSK